MDIPKINRRGYQPRWDALILRASIGDADHAKDCQRILGDDWDYKRDLVWSLKEPDGKIVAAMVTQKVICSATDRTKIHILNLAGSGFAEWGMKTLPVIEQYARYCEAYSITVAGRKGWAKVLPGFTHNADGLLERVL